jgi:hypothetical protein
LHRAKSASAIASVVNKFRCQPIPPNHPQKKTFQTFQTFQSSLTPFFVPKYSRRVVKIGDEKMKWLTKVAIFFGRKKFEEFAQANPQLPDDALAVANTLDTFPVRGAVALIAGSLAHVVDSTLRGSETVEQLATHALLVLAGLCIIWVRHAISKHDVAVNTVVQQARSVSGISGNVSALLLPFVIFVFFVVNNPSARAQTNTLSSATNAATLFTQLLSDVGSVTKFSSGVGVNFHGKVAPLLSQELSLFGHSGTNSSWTTGPSHATFFLPQQNEEQIGWSFSGSWQSPPRILRFALFNASDIDWTLTGGLPAEDYYYLFRHIDWRETRFGASITRKF